MELTPGVDSLRFHLLESVSRFFVGSTDVGIGNQDGDAMTWHTTLYRLTDSNFDSLIADDLCTIRSIRVPFETNEQKRTQIISYETSTQILNSQLFTFLSVKWEI